MRIASARVQGYRSIADLTIDFNDLTALVGAGGVGKSALLRAIRWFFEGGTLDEDDLHLPLGNGDDAAGRIIVTVTFADLNDLDRGVLKQYASEDPTTLTRSWRPEEKDKLSGTALVFPDFDPVRDEQASAADKKARYKALYETRGQELHLPEPINRVDELLTALEVWERKNPDQCEPRTEHARHLEGAIGTPILKDCFKYVLVEATTEAGDVVRDSRGTPLDRLLSAIGELDEETNQTIESLRTRTQEDMTKLLSGARAEDLDRIARGITERVQSYVRGAEVQLSDVVEVRRPDVTVLAQVRHLGGHPTDIQRQGHGLQRALVIAVLHELADSSALLGVQAQEAPPRPSLMLAIEEPELYQHPLQARALAGTLRELADASQASTPRSLQVAYSTHSAHFVRPALFESLPLCFRGEAGQTTCVAADRDEVAKILDDAGFTGELKGKVEYTLAKTLAEAVFAQAVVLCEGPTDAALLEAVAARNGGLDREGISVVRCHGKPWIPVALSILRQLSIPTYILFDAGAAKQDPDDAQKNRLLLTLCGEDEEDWPPQAVRDRCANFADDLETFLKESWPELISLKDRLGRELGMKGKKEEIYRQAALEADAVPSFFTDLLGKVRAAP
jgi:putative ATP-dependent endonuclease of OLD family